MPEVTVCMSYSTGSFDERPFVSKGSHPIETGRYLLLTNEIEKLFKTVTGWIDRRSPGGIIYGRPRLGKTRAVTFLTQVIPQELEAKIPIFHTCCRQYKQVNENHFFEDILQDVGHIMSSIGKAQRKRNRLTHFFLEQAEASRQHRIVLFIDDAQRLFEIQYGWLMDLNNELDRAGVSLTVLLVGQKELLHQRSALIQAKKAQIIGRFMIHEYKFSGIENISDIEVCLKGYDMDSEFPENSGWSFVRYFFPEAFSHGLRLEQCAGDLHTVFQHLRQEAKVGRSFEIPMQYLTASIEYALRQFGANGHGVEWLTSAHWREAVIQSGYLEGELYQEFA